MNGLRAQFWLLIQIVFLDCTIHSYASFLIDNNTLLSGKVVFLATLTNQTSREFDEAIMLKSVILQSPYNCCDVHSEITHKK